MHRQNKLSRRSLVQSLAFLPAATAAFQNPLPPDKSREFWNKIYAEEDSRVTDFPNRFLAEVVQGVKPGQALDIGMGQGRNTLFLARRGWDVTGVDIADKGIEMAKKAAARRNLKFNGVASDFAVFEVGKQRWDLLVGVYMGDLITSLAARLVEGLRPGGLLVVENFHRDINVKAITGGTLGYAVNALLEAFVPSLRIVRYEEVLDFADWGSRVEKVPLVRLLARKG
ncbi:MAG: class I SAM-dependent methyltransferase [Blastocatellales bacterium]